MSIYDDYSNPYTSSDATVAYNAPQTAGYSSQSGSPTNPPPTYYQGPSASAPPSGGIAGMVQNLTNGMVGGIDNHPLTLMSLGAGIAQGGIGRGLALATAAAQAERNLQAQQVNHAHVLNALTGAGVPPDEALAAVLNPSLMRVLAVKYLGPRAGGNAASAAAPAGAAAGTSPPPGNAASYWPNATYGASNNSTTAWPTQGQAAAAPSPSPGRRVFPPGRSPVTAGRCPPNVDCPGRPYYESLQSRQRGPPKIL